MIKKGSDTKIFLILENIRDHQAKKLKPLLEDNRDNIELFYIPSYSPELNPDELLNKDVQSNAVGRNRAKNLTEMKSNITKYLFRAQNCSDIVKSYLQKSEVRYAA